MAILTFPTPTFNGQLYPTSPLPGETQYQWSEPNQTWVLLGVATGVAPGTYGDGGNVGQFTVDTQGKITFAQNVPIVSGAGGTVTSVGSGTGLTGGPIVSAGSLSLLPATTASLGGVVPDGTTIVVDGAGVISVAGAGNVDTLQQVTTSGNTTTNKMIFVDSVSTSNSVEIDPQIGLISIYPQSLGDPGFYISPTGPYFGNSSGSFFAAGLVPASLQFNGSLGTNIKTASPTVPVQLWAGGLGGVASPQVSVTGAATTLSNQLIASGLSYPAADGTSGQVLTTNGSGILSWSTTPTPSLQAVTSAGATTTDTITIGGLISNGALLPGAHETYDIGSPTARWNTLYVKNTSIYLGPYKLSVVGGQLTIDGTVTGTGTVTDVTAGVGLSGGTITTSGTINLADTPVTAGSYTYGSFTVDAQGRLTAASNGAAPVTAVTGTSPISVTAGTTPTVSIATASITQPGAVQLNDTVTSGSTTEAATANAVKTAYDLANSAMPKSGGTFTGGVTFNTTPTYSAGADIGPADKVTYDNTTSGLTATEVQGAIDEVVAGLCVGTVTSVGTGTGLSGGAITTSGTIALNEAGPASLGGVLGVSNGSSSNVALGNTAGALFSSTVDNVAIGDYAMASASGSCNIAIGPVALGDVSGSRNVGIGSGALLNATAATNNVAIGYQALSCLTTGCNNTEIGANNGLTSTYSPPFLVTNQCNRLILGSTATTNAYVQVDWTVVSDERDKTEIQPIALGLDFVSQLDPVSFRFKESREDDTAVGPTRYGFTAQSVLAVEGDNPVIVDVEDPENLKMTNSSLIPVLVQAIKELKAEVEALKSQLK